MFIAFGKWDSSLQDSQTKWFNIFHGIPILLRICNIYHTCMVTVGNIPYTDRACGIPVWLDHIYFRPVWKANESAVVSEMPFCIPIAMILKSVLRPYENLKSPASHSWKMIWLKSSTSRFATKPWLEKGFIYLLVSKYVSKTRDLERSGQNLIDHTWKQFPGDFKKPFNQLPSLKQIAKGKLPPTTMFQGQTNCGG